MREIRFWVGNLIYLFAVVLFLLIFIRFLFNLFGIAYLPIINEFSDLFIGGVIGTFGSRVFAGLSFNFDLLFALGVVMATAIVLEQLILGFLRTSLSEILLEIFVSIFKVIEYFLIFRIFILAGGGNLASGFSNFIFGTSSPFNPLLSIVNVKILYGQIEVVSLVMLIVLLIIEYALIEAFENRYHVERAEDSGPFRRFRRVTTVEYRK